MYKSFHRFPTWSLSTLILICLLSFVFSLSLPASPHAGSEPKTIMVTAEGLADPSSALYSKDRALMIDDLRRDARRQAVEKAVGVYVESSTLVENYLLIEDRVLSKSKGLIKQIVEQSTPQLGEDGLMHIHITAEVFISDVKDALQTLSKEGRISLIKERGNPTISVAIVVKDAKRGENREVTNSPIAENILKGQFVDFGYRVWSEEYTDILRKDIGTKKRGRRIADFSVIGEVKFRQSTITLKASGIKLTKHALTSWTVKCINNHTGEEVYFNNQVPKNKAWADEDVALEEIGKLIGNQFTKDFFTEQLMQPSKLYELQLKGLPDYDTALLLKDEFVGLRNILSAELINFESGGLSQFEIDCTGSTSNFAKTINNTVLRPLNKKLDGPRLKLMSYHGNVVLIEVAPGNNPGQLQRSLLEKPPSSLATASPERINTLIKDSKIREEVGRMNPAITVQ